MNPSGNIAYSTPAIETFFRDHRVRWEEFYPSERAVLEELALTANSSVLDLGCGCGGLGLALRERFGVLNYTGVEINRQATETACKKNPTGRFICKDILDLSSSELGQDRFDVVVSLSCIDWNVRFSEMFSHAFRYVRSGGCLVATFRLTPFESFIDSPRSYQYINFDGRKEGEIAPYVVLNFRDFMNHVAELAPAKIRAVGYWGSPSPTAVTPLARIVFCAVALWKRSGAGHEQVRQLDLPQDLLAGSEISPAR